MYTLDCVFKEVLEYRDGENKEGKKWEALKFRCTYESNGYTNDVVFSASYSGFIERIQKLEDGASVKIEFSPGGNHWEEKDKWFEKNTAFKVFNNEDTPL